MGALLHLPRHKLSIADYHRMGDAGILHPTARVELIEGEIIDMAPIGSLHASVVATLAELLVVQVRGRAIVFTQNPVTLPPNSEPQPDIALLKPRTDRYRDALPLAADTLLVIEVADTTLQYDREVKMPLYARHGIPEAWLFDLRGGTVNVYLEPGDAGYGKGLRRQRHETIAPTLLPEVRLPLGEIWPD